MQTCWPEWLTRKIRERIGPNYESDIAYPVYQVQPAILSADNPNGNSQSINDGYYQSASGQVLLANLDTTIIHIMPNTSYDTINIVAFTSPASAAGPPRLPGLGAPLFFSMDKPGRIVTEVKLQGSEEAFVATCRPFTPDTDFSSFPTCIITPDTSPNLALNALAATYTNFNYPTIKTNRPFFFWFADGINTLPAAPVTAVNFKVSWYVQGR